jgi:hypothetical protein
VRPHCHTYPTSSSATNTARGWLPGQRQGGTKCTLHCPGPRACCARAALPGRSGASLSTPAWPACHREAAPSRLGSGLLLSSDHRRMTTALAGPKLTTVAKGRRQSAEGVKSRPVDGRKGTALPDSGAGAWNLTQASGDGPAQRLATRSKLSAASASPRLSQRPSLVPAAFGGAIVHTIQVGLESRC